ncbi:MAG TPA: hypothetical protein VFK06_02600 [Candidatus Angelobacter sp.]|nr:hypothetical protein [Candidatus Angelobacter sp.]
MAASESSNWDSLKQKYPNQLTDALRGHFVRGPFRITAQQLAIEANVNHEVSKQILRELVEAGALTTNTEYTCPCERIEHLTSEHAGEEVCIHCNRTFAVDVLGTPVPVTRFVREAPETRDVRWMLALHGMNTEGAWQETFNWLVSRSYRRSVPIAIYKYGVVRPGAVLKFRQQALVRDLNARIRRLSGDTESTGFGGVPDVIAHSLGTWLLGHALIEDSTLQVGRVILTGCILRPDFDWGLLLERGQVESVLCHVATKDFWARISHYIIPDSGPSGHLGFNDKERIAHAVLEGRHHSDFFNETEMPTLFEQVWQPFLTESLGQTATGVDTRPVRIWSEAWWPFRASVFRLLLLAIGLGLILVIVAALALGIADLARIIYEGLVDLKVALESGW